MGAVLKYEFQIRKKAMELVKEDGMKLGAALDEAMLDSEVRALYFTAHVTLGRQRQGGKGDYQGIREKEPLWKKPRRAGKGDDKDKEKTKAKGKGKGKSSGKGKQQGYKGGLPVCGSTPDGRAICYKWNDGDACDGSCGRLHVCRVMDCLDASHPMCRHAGFDANKRFQEK